MELWGNDLILEEQLHLAKSREHHSSNRKPRCLLPAVGPESLNLESMGLFYTNSTVSQPCYPTDPGSGHDDFSYADLMMLISPGVNQAYDTVGLLWGTFHDFLTVKLLFIHTYLVNSLHYQLCKIKTLHVGFPRIRMSWVTWYASGQVWYQSSQPRWFSRYLSSFPFQEVVLLAWNAFLPFSSVKSCLLQRADHSFPCVTMYLAIPPTLLIVRVALWLIICFYVGFPY